MSNHISIEIEDVEQSGIETVDLDLPSGLIPNPVIKMHYPE